MTNNHRNSAYILGFCLAFALMLIACCSLVKAEEVSVKLGYNEFRISGPKHGIAGSIEATKSWKTLDYGVELGVIWNRLLGTEDNKTYNYVGDL